MIARLLEYVHGDSRARRLGDRTSLFLAFFCYLAGVALHRPGTLFQSILVLIVCQVGTTLWYCLKPQLLHSTKAVQPSRRMTLKAAGGFAFAIVGAVLSGPKIEAAIFNQRLRRLSEHPTPQSPKIASALLASANEERVVVGKAAVEQIVAHRLTLEDVSNAVIATVNQSAIDRSIELPIAAVRVKKKTVTGEIILNGMSGELRPGNLLTLGVDPRVASLVYPDMTAFFGPIGSAVTSPQYAGAGYIVVDGREGTIVIPLDGLHCKNVIFLKCTLVYAGKAVKLDNTGFGNSQFEFSANLACQELAEAILKNPALNYSRP